MCVGGAGKERERKTKTGREREIVNFRNIPVLPSTGEIFSLYVFVGKPGYPCGWSLGQTAFI